MGKAEGRFHKYDNVIYCPLIPPGGEGVLQEVLLYLPSPNGGEGKGEGEVISNEKRYVTEFINRCTNVRQGSI
jgi:hypothetical protein